MANQQYDCRSRFRRGRRRFRRLRHGNAALGRPVNPRRPAGSRRRGPQPLDPHPSRLRQDLRRRLGELVLPGGARSRRQRPQHLLAARQGSRRLLVDQRHGLHPRPARGLRPLAPARQHRLVIDRRAALLQARPTPDPRRRRIPQHRRAALRVRHIGTPSDLRSLHQGRHGTRLSAQRRLQRREAGRRRLPPDDHAQRQALLDRRRLPAPGAQRGPTCASSPARWPRRCCSTASAPSASHSANTASRAPCVPRAR